MKGGVWVGREKKRYKDGMWEEKWRQNGERQYGKDGSVREDLGK